MYFKKKGNTHAHRERQNLEHQADLLRRKSSGSYHKAPRDGKARDLLASGTVLGKRKKDSDVVDTRTMYEKYRRLYEHNVERQEKKIFENEEDASDPFFLDPEREEHAKILEDNQRKVEETLRKNRQLRHNKSGFTPYAEKAFKGSGIALRKKTNMDLSEYGKESATPTAQEMKHIDPATWKSNINFIPIPATKNKMLKLK
ncbi:hypothetical protein AKO1_009005 [Acrasis kona]|uniref:Uncharacterized protein n=1 Tax=Acrasis kona TaxID=1008807 RepID=A0AAW2ZGU5_9EUKA